MKRLLALICCYFALASAVVAAESSPVGEITFLIGDARIAAGAEAGAALKRGVAVRAGQLIETGDNGHLHIRFVDGAAIAVRPHSRLKIEDYRYDPQRPDENRIRFRLEEGAMRSITGRGGEAARDRFRLNTPIAAIGIKGTDFNVQTTSELTRASVFEGSIVVAPLGGGCEASAYGPCQVAAARELGGAQKDAYALEVRASQALTELVPRRAELPAARESLLARGATGPSGDELPRTLAETRAVSALVSAGPPVPTTPVPTTPVPLPPPPPVVEPLLWWGRWAAYADPADPASSYAAQAAVAGRETAAGNTVFGLLRESLIAPQYPTRGAFSFGLVRAEAYTVVGSTLTPAAVQGGTLSLDFDAQRFATQLSVQPMGLSRLDMTSRGRIEGDGRFYADPGQSMWVFGAVAPKGRQAGYAFDRALGGGASLSGATLWAR